MQSPKLPKGFTPEQLKELISKHGSGKVIPIVVKKDGKEYVGLFKKPTLSIIDAGTSESRDAQGVDPMKLTEFVYRNCKLVADPEMDNDDEVHSTARNLAFSLFKSLQGEVGEAFV